MNKSILFAPTILEHAAGVIGLTPSEATKDSAHIAKAHIEAFRRYRHPFVTVGIDIYNIEAEALGCEVRFYEDNSIPGIISHPYTLDDDPETIAFSMTSGRIQSILDAAREVKKAIGDEATVSIGICGPFSVLIELLGYDSAIEYFLEEDDRLIGYLDAITTFLKEYCDVIVDNKLGVTVFDSWAAPPLTSPKYYRKYALPYQFELLSYLKQLGLFSRPLVIGGDTRLIADDIIKSGTTLLVSDYNTPLSEYIEKAKEHNITLRANIDPKMLHAGNWEGIRNRLNEISTAYETYPKIIIGTGVIPYDTPADHILQTGKMIYGI